MQVVVPDEFKYLYEGPRQSEVVKIPAPVLRETAMEVKQVSKRIKLLIENMERILHAANGVGLAAPQVGVSERVVLIAPPNTNKPIALINPVIAEQEGSEVGEEGCLSIPGLYGDVTRAARVTVEALDRKGRPVRYGLEGYAARIVQHEVDHLNGVLFLDKVDMATLHWAHPVGSEPEDAPLR